MARRIEKTNAKHGDKGKLSKDIVNKLLVKQNCKCAYCSADITNERDIDHITPLGLGGPNIDENIQLLCKPCNRAKAIKHPSEFISLLSNHAQVRLTNEQMMQILEDVKAGRRLADPSLIPDRWK